MPPLTTVAEATPWSAVGRLWREAPGQGLDVFGGQFGNSIPRVNPNPPTNSEISFTDLRPKFGIRNKSSTVLLTRSPMYTMLSFFKQGADRTESSSSETLLNTIGFSGGVSLKTTSPTSRTGHDGPNYGGKFELFPLAFLGRQVGQCRFALGAVRQEVSFQRR